MNVNDFEFKPDCPAERIDQAVEWLKSKRQTFGSTTNFAIFSQTGDVLHKLSQPCHGAIGRDGLKLDRCVVATENGSSRNSLWGVRKPGHEEKRRPFCKWIVEESFFGRFILVKDIDFCLNYGFVISADMPCPLLQNLLITTRHFFECNEAAFDVFNKLSEQGINKTFAYLLAFCSNLSVLADPTQLPGAKQLYSYTGHRAWDFPRTLKTLKNLLAGEFGPSFKHDCDPSRHYRKFATIYGGKAYGVEGVTQNANGYSPPPQNCFTEDLIQDEKFIARLKEFRGPAEAKSDVINPFKAITSIIPKPGLVTYEEMINVVIPYLKEESII